MPESVVVAEAIIGVAAIPAIATANTVFVSFIFIFLQSEDICCGS